MERDTTATKYLKLYHYLMRHGCTIRKTENTNCYLGQEVGLCSMLKSELGPQSLNSLDLFKPTSEDEKKYELGSWWGSGESLPRKGEFNTVRQNIVLFLAAMNNEL